jgi:hypothetical protein
VLQGIDCINSTGVEQLFCTSTVIEDWFGCCGVGSCNVFCCDCDHGCKTFDSCPAGWSPATKRRDLTGSGNATDSDCVEAQFQILDSQVEQDGLITFAEFVAGWYLVKPGFNQSWWHSAETYAAVAAKLIQYDADGDGTLSLEECQQTLS